MLLSEAPVVDIRHLLVEERADLLLFLRSLPADGWTAESAAPGWSVKDLALHVLDDDLGWLSRGRDGDRSGLLDASRDYGAFVQALAAKNQRWVHQQQMREAAGRVEDHTEVSGRRAPDLRLGRSASVPSSG